VAVDVRYFDYKSVDGFGDHGFLPSGAVAGLGWDSVWSVGVGVHRHLSERVAVQVGYWYGDSPIRDAVSSYNVASPLTTEHAVSAGVSCWMENGWRLHATYLHGFEGRVNGPLQTPGGALAGTTISSATSADALALGITVGF
jgi:long-chain fatty acid transport protein